MGITCANFRIVEPAGVIALKVAFLKRPEKKVLRVQKMSRIAVIHRLRLNNTGWFRLLEIFCLAQ